MSEIPSWVYFLFLALLYIGYKNGFKRVLKTKILLVIPAVVLWFSLKNLVKIGENLPLQLLYYGIGGLIGLYLGYLHARSTKLRADKEQQLIELPGDWTILPLILIIFAIQFAIGYLLATDHELAQNRQIIAAICIASGITTGIIVGRNLTYFYKFHKAPHVHLEMKNQRKK